MDAPSLRPPVLSRLFHPWWTLTSFLCFICLFSRQGSSSGPWLARFPPFVTSYKPPFMHFLRFFALLFLLRFHVYRISWTFNSYPTLLTTCSTFCTTSRAPRRPSRSRQVWSKLLHTHSTLDFATHPSFVQLHTYIRVVFKNEHP